MTAPAPRRTQKQRRDEAEDRMLAAAARLVGRVGLSGLTLALVGEEAGYSRGLPNHHFGSREVLVGKLVDRITSGFERRMTRKLPASSRPGLAALRVIAATYLADVWADPVRGRALMAMINEGLTSADVGESIRAVNARSIAFIAEHVRAAQATGDVADHGDADAIAATILAALRGASQLMLFADAARAAVLRETCVELLIGGLAAR